MTPTTPTLSPTPLNIAPAHPGSMRAQLRAALLDHFPTRSDLSILLDDTLSQSLDQIAATSLNQTETANELVKWLWIDRTGRLRPVLVMAIQMRGNSVELARLFAELFPEDELQMAPPGTTVIPAAVRESAIRFNEQLRARRQQFQYLNAFKGLHECLHQLQELDQGIRQAAAAFRRRPDAPAGLATIAGLLSRLVRTARASQSQLEIPEDVEGWLSAFERAVAGIAAIKGPADLSGLEEALSTLGALPSQQASLNADLVRCARRLRPNDLVQRIGELLSHLNGPSAPVLDDLRASAERFRELCTRLSESILDHSACQAADIAFTPVVARRALIPPAPVTNNYVDGWIVVRDGLKRISARQVENLYAAQVSGLLDEFDVQRDERAGECFDQLMEWFRRLFSKADKDLLSLTGDLVQQAERIDLFLRIITHA